VIDLIFVIPQEHYATEGKKEMYKNLFLKNPIKRAASSTVHAAALLRAST